MGSNHILTRTPRRVATEMSLRVLAYDLKSTIKIIRASAGSGMPATEWDRQIRDFDRAVKPYVHGQISPDQGQGQGFARASFPQGPCGDGRRKA
jgi:hypothetical protein